MKSNVETPEGSAIQERVEWDGRTLYWPLPGGGCLRFGVGGFLCVWLCGWAAGWVAVAIKLVTEGFQPFLAIWLTGWTIGGIVAMWFAVKLLRPTNPESVTMGEDEFRHDPGWSVFAQFPMQGTWFPYPGPPRWTDGWMRRRKPLTLPRAELGKFVLERVGERQRLTFDHGADRVEIGAVLREPEREWLYGVLEEWRMAR